MTVDVKICIAICFWEASIGDIDGLYSICITDVDCVGCYTNIWSVFGVEGVYHCCFVANVGMVVKP